MTSRSASAVHEEQGRTALALCEAAALASRADALLGGVRAQLDAFARQTGATREIGTRELAQLSAGAEELAELVAQIALVVEGLPLVPLAAGERELAAAARAALAQGIVDDRRALATACLLTADEGLPALADALVGSDAHVYWDARVVDVLGAFRDVDEERARRLAALAGVSHTARFRELPPEGVTELAQVARRRVAR